MEATRSTSRSRSRLWRRPSSTTVTLATDKDAWKKINPSMLGLVAAQDRGIPPADAKKFGETLDPLGKKIDIKIYDDAGHACENPNNKDGYRAAEAADACNRSVGFFSDRLKD